MTTLYADRHATPKPRDTPANWRVDWDLFAALRAARTPIHLVAPTRIDDPCSACPNDAIYLCDAEAWLVYRSRGGHWTYRDPIGRCCVAWAADQLRALGVTGLRIEMPAVAR